MSDPDSLFAQLESARERKRPPVESWNPSRTGSSAMRIAADGRWFYRDSEIRRPEMVRLFSSILRRDEDAYVLVTPVERLTIEVEDAPFVAVDLEARESGEGQRLLFKTNVDDLVEVDSAHPIRVSKTSTGPRPYVLVRNRMEALILRPVYYRLVELALPGPNGRAGVWSNHVFFDLETAA